MAFLNFRRNPDNALESGGRKVSQTAAEKNEITCPNCHRAVDAEKLAATLSCCPHCGHHRLSDNTRLLHGSGGAVEIYHLATSTYRPSGSIL